MNLTFDGEPSVVAHKACRRDDSRANVLLYRRDLEDLTTVRTWLADEETATVTLVSNSSRGTSTLINELLDGCLVPADTLPVPVSWHVARIATTTNFDCLLTTTPAGAAPTITTPPQPGNDGKVPSKTKCTETLLDLPTSDVGLHKAGLCHAVR